MAKRLGYHYWEGRTEGRETHETGRFLDGIRPVISPTYIRWAMGWDIATKVAILMGKMEASQIRWAFG